MTAGADAIVVLGGPISAEGDLSEGLRLRMERALSGYRGGLAPRLVLTGGAAIMEMNTRLVSEASAMREYALRSGVPLSDLFVEERSRDTLENAFFTRRIHLESNGWRRLLLVTNAFHSERAGYTFRSVLGPDYGIRALDAEDPPTDDAGARKMKELALLAFAREVLGPLVPGDQDQLEKLLCYNHPVYR